MIKSYKFNDKLELMVSRQYVPLFANYFFLSYSDPKNFKKFYKTSFFSRLVCIGNGWHYGPESKRFGHVVFGQEVQDASVNTLKRKKKNFKEILEIFDRIYTYGESLLKFSHKINKINFSGFSQKQLIELFDKFSKDYIVFCTSLMGFNIQFVVEENLHKFLQGDKDVEEELAVLTFPDKQNIAAQEVADLLRLHIKLEGAGVNSLKECKTKELNLLKKHVEKYGWINARGAMDNAWTIEQIFERAMTEKDCVKRLKEMVKNQKEHFAHAKLMLASKKASQDDKNLVKIAKELVYFRTYRTDYINWMFFNIRPLLNALAKKLGIGYDDIACYLQKEILSGKKVSSEEISRRKQGYAFALIKPNDICFSSDPKKISDWRDKYTEDNNGDVKEVKGMPAFKGVIRGRAVLVLNKEDMAKVKSGDIMVTFMTTPNMVPVMQKAIAFVTDEGGITCHAAIVAREMKKPCVIGTKNATRVFKDGDLVEVDANNGVVKIVKI